MEIAVSDRHLEPDVGQLAQEVERYLSLYPGAADTLEGIARWWLVRTQVEALLPRVEAALDHLVDRGVLTRRLLPDGNCVYARANAPSRRTLGDA